MSGAKVELGRHLFYDLRLSGNASASCVFCHRQELAFTDGLPRALGSTGELHPRSSMTLANVAYNATFTWANPDLESLEDQIHIPLLNENPIELGVAGSKDLVLARLRDAPGYEELFLAAFPEVGDPIMIETVIKALASFSRTLISGNSAYDRLVYADEREGLSASARRGMRLFFSERVRCSECHGGFNLSGLVRYRGAAAPGVFHNTGLYNLQGSGLYPPDNPGLRAFTKRPEDTGRFRAPTLRNIALTAPYMHDGSIATLEQVIDHYAAGARGTGAARDAPKPYTSPLVRGFVAREQERADLVPLPAEPDRPELRPRSEVCKPVRLSGHLPRHEAPATLLVLPG